MSFEDSTPAEQQASTERLATSEMGRANRLQEECWKLKARVAELEARKESANVNMMAVSEYTDRLESLVGSASMDRHYMRRRINIADKSGEGGKDGK